MSSACTTDETGTGSIDAAAVNRALAGTRLGGSVLHLAEVDSTQTLALAAARAGARRGVWVADAQTAGRGRGGHTWHSAPGDGLYLTALFTPRLPAAANQLSLVAGLAAWDAICEVAGLTVDIRWPNDLVARPDPHRTGPARKLGGILAETAVTPVNEHDGAPAMLRYAAIGIGLNVGQAAFPPELAATATSLRLEAPAAGAVARRPAGQARPLFAPSGRQLRWHGSPFQPHAEARRRFDLAVR